MSREYVFGWDREREFFESMNEDSVREFTVSGDVFADANGLSLSSAVWTPVFGNISIGSNTETGNKTTAQVTADSVCRSQFKVTLTFDDGQKGVIYFNIDVEEREDRTERYF